MKSFSTICCAVLVFAGISGICEASETKSSVPLSAEKVNPIKVGASLPKMTLKDAAGKDFSVNEAVAKQPTLLVIYRGGWCPYCNQHLASLSRAQDDLKGLGYQILAISADPWEKLKEAADSKELGYSLLSDSDMKASKDLGIAFKLDKETITKYKGYGIPIADHEMLPVPTVLLVNKAGKVVYRHYDPDYRKRLSSDELMTAAKKASQS